MRKKLIIDNFFLEKHTLANQRPRILVEFFYRVSVSFPFRLVSSCFDLSQFRLVRSRFVVFRSQPVAFWLRFVVGWFRCVLYAEFRSEKLFQKALSVYALRTVRNDLSNRN